MEEGELSLEELELSHLNFLHLFLYLSEANPAEATSDLR